jgi:hypothetical protein
MYTWSSPAKTKHLTVAPVPRINLTKNIHTHIINTHVLMLPTAILLYLELVYAVGDWTAVYDCVESKPNFTPTYFITVTE